MAVRSPTLERTGGAYDPVPIVTWRGVTSSDTVEHYLVRGQYGFAGSLQISGTFGTPPTVSLTSSNDGINFFPAEDPTGALITTTTGAIFEISLSSAYIKPSIVGGSGYALDFILVLRG